ncbi:fasciclin domain-containing protein [Costertonia aggregata]|uniref:Fasciclin domain-containing protein n=1 Tax=Costertonia aggregata TaxID=343403 RepID=A0A7H9ASH9_9FLAO|nr:fasciclin domain-containing protein [Costertonia aggregata]QLG46413.1 fasciclin domain-containing protein [Costertonia aggregata]
MSKYLRFKSFLVISALVIAFVSCSDDDNDPTPQPALDVVGIASNTAELSNLVAALEKVDLVGTLQGAGPFTIFAPNDEAFAQFLSANGFASLEAVPDDVLTQVLLNHVVSGDLGSGDLSTGFDLSTLATGAGGLNLSLSIDTSDGVKVNGSTVTAPNRKGTNGTIHIIDAVIGLPTTPVTFVTTNPNLSSLATALTTATPNNDFVTTLSGDGPFTILAPTDDAFAELLGRLDGFDSFDDFNTEQLQTLLATILQYHVVSGDAEASADLTNEQVITTLQGEDLTVRIEGGVVSFLDADIEQPANVAVADIVASNAIVHAIDKVLLPQEAVDALEGVLLSSITDIAIATPALSNLVAALVAANGELPTVLRGDGPFTVFAPTDAAFKAFLEANDFATLGDVPVDVLTNVLLNHVVSGANFSTDLTTGYVSTLSTSGPEETALSMFINTADGVVLNGGRANSGATVATADIKASNGVVHVVNGVIGLPNVVNHAIANPQFTTLVNALTTLTPATDFASILARTEGENEDGINPSFTVFAPTNSAFAALDAIPAEPTLTQVLLHHVVGGANVRSTALTPDGDTVATTLENDEITITLPGTGDNIADVQDGSGNNDIGITAVDVQATNGVIHVLNKVMIPNTTNNSN